MTIPISRRSVLKTAALGTALAVTPIRFFSAEAAATPALDGSSGTASPAATRPPPR